MRKQTFITELIAVREELYQQLKFILSRVAYYHKKDEEQYEEFLQQRFAIEKTISKLNFIIREEADLVLKDIVEEQQNDNT